jgi:hypothetical protein
MKLVILAALLVSAIAQAEDKGIEHTISGVALGGTVIAGIADAKLVSEPLLDARIEAASIADDLDRVYKESFLFRQPRVVETERLEPFLKDRNERIQLHSGKLKAAEDYIKTLKRRRIALRGGGILSYGIFLAAPYIANVELSEDTNPAVEMIEPIDEATGKASN